MTLPTFADIRFALEALAAGRPVVTPAIDDLEIRRRVELLEALAACDFVAPVDGKLEVTPDGFELLSSFAREAQC